VGYFIWLLQVEHVLQDAVTGLGPDSSVVMSKCSFIWVWVNTYRYIFSGMNIHLPAILGFTRYQGFDPSPYSCLPYIGHFPPTIGTHGTPLGKPLHEKAVKQLLGGTKTRAITITFGVIMVGQFQHLPYGSKYLLRKCLGYNLLSFGGLSTFSDSVWIHRVSSMFFLLEDNLVRGFPS